MYIRMWTTTQQVTMGKLKKEVRDLDGLRFMMNMLKEVRQRESGINMEINPIMNMYQVKRKRYKMVPSRRQQTTACRLRVWHRKEKITNQLLRASMFKGTTNST